jgi:membrane protease YdiL (CAAX protease family)
MDNPEAMDEEVRKEPLPGPAEAPGAGAPDPTPLAGAEPEVFWGYADLCLFVFFGLLGLLACSALLKIEAAVFHFAKPPVAALLSAQMVTYATLFGGLRLMFRMQYNRPFWSSLGWRALPVAAPYVVAVGALTAAAASVAGGLIHLPQTGNQMTELLSQGNLAILLMAVFGVGIAPLCEELAFRGFLQPLLARSFGAPAGILAAGVAFGLLRHATKSTKASVIMHASYNGLLFVLLALAIFAERNQHH